MNTYENKVKWCPVCDQGWIEIVKDSSTQKFYLYCNECESEWTNPTEIRKDNGTQDVFQTCERVTLAEIEKEGWEEFILK